MKLRVGSYNVEFSKSTTAEEVGRMLRPFRFDLVGFCEVPDGEWTARAGREMGLEHAFVGAVSSAHHVNKYKSILSRAPLVRTGEVYVQVAGGWNPASVVEADMRFGDVPVRFHSLHVCSCGLARGHAHLVAEEVLRHETDRYTIAVGDYNCRLGDGTCAGSGTYICTFFPFPTKTFSARFNLSQAASTCNASFFASTSTTISI